jgi:hypothetical protein
LSTNKQPLSSGSITTSIHHRYGRTRLFLGRLAPE